MSILRLLNEHMYYIRAFVESLYNKNWIVSQRKQLTKAMVYTAILAAIFSLFAVITFGRVVQKELRPELTNILNDIPAFQAQLTDGVLTVENLPQPYQQESITEQESAIFYIDTSPSTTIDVLGITDGYDFAVVIDEEQFQVIQSDGTVDGYFFRESKDDLQLTDTEVKEFVESFVFGKLFVGISVLAFLIMTVVLTIGVLIWTLAFSLLIALIAKIMKLPILYLDIVTMGLFARTILFILDLFRLLPIYSEQVAALLPTIDIVLWIVIMVVVLLQYKQTIQADGME